MLKVSTPSLIYTAAALLSAISIHLLYRLAEHLVRSGRVSRRDYVMVPGILLIAALIGLGLEWLDAHARDLLAGVGFAAFLGLNIGQRVPRGSARPGR